MLLAVTVDAFVVVTAVVVVVVVVVAVAVVAVVVVVAVDVAVVVVVKRKFKTFDFIPLPEGVISAGCLRLPFLLLSRFSCDCCSCLTLAVAVARAFPSATHVAASIEAFAFDKHCKPLC